MTMVNSGLKGLTTNIHQSIVTSKLILTQSWPGISGTDQTLQQRFSKGPCELRKPLWVFILRPTLCMGLVISVIGITYCGESLLRLHVII